MKRSTRLKAIFAFALLVVIAFFVMREDDRRTKEEARRAMEVKESAVGHHRAYVLARIGLNRRQIVRDFNRNATLPKELLVRLARVEIRVRNEDRVEESAPVLKAAEAAMERIEEEIARLDEKQALTDLRWRLDR